MKFFLPLLPILLLACDRGPSPALSPGKELATFRLAQGFRAELVASDPMIQDPVVIKFDQDGRLWVVEMRGFMPDIDGSDENAPVGRVSILSDTDNDGHMDTSTIFADSLVLPRGLAIVKGGALVAEDGTLWFMEDLNGDLIADRKSMVDADYGKPGVIEHSANGLWRGMDNWIYNAKSKYRYRQENGSWVKEETEFRGQWGICHDDHGRLYYNYNWSQLHMDQVPPNYLSRNPNHQPTSGIDYPLSQDRRVFPIRSNLAINRGYVDGTLDETGKIIEFASACAPFIYRGALLGEDFIGNAFVCEPTGNLIKRNIITWSGLIPSASNAYPNEEFLASTDERFRPVWLESGPDGALYVADMYRGIVQHGPYMSPYLREVTLMRKLDQPINLGRIWRIVPEDQEKHPQTVKLSDLTVVELIQLLAHQNGWYRDMAQRILIERANNEAIKPLKQVIQNHENHLARLHSLWILDGLNFTDVDFYFQILGDPSPVIKAISLRLIEKQAKKDSEVQLRLQKALLNPKLELPKLQVALTAGIADYPTRQQILIEIITGHSDSQIFRDAVLSSIYQDEYKFLRSLLKHSSWEQYTTDKEIFIEQLAASVMSKQQPKELVHLLELLNSNKQDWKTLAIINGLSFFNPTSEDARITLQKPPKIFQTKLPDSVLMDKVAKLSLLFTWPGKPTSVNNLADKITYEIDPQVISRGRNLYLTVCASCHGNDGKGMSRFAPPLFRSEWVLESPERLSRILLHGMEGPVNVNGKNYQTPDILPVMPAFATTPAEDLAAIMTYIRQEWGHNASPVDPGLVGKIRVMSQGKITPWTVEELLEKEH